MERRGRSLLNALTGLWRAPAGLAGFLLCTIPMGSCIVPENITPIPTSTTHATPVITSVAPNVPYTCLDDQENKENPTTFMFQVTDADASVLQVRWYVDYSFPPTNAVDGAIAESLTPRDTGDPSSYPSGEITSDVLGFTVVGIHTLDVALTDAFDADGTALPRNRAPAPGSYVASYRWVINYIGPGTCPVVSQ